MTPRSDERPTASRHREARRRPAPRLLPFLALLLLPVAAGGEAPAASPSAAAPAPAAPSADRSRAPEREAMVREQIEARGVRDRRVLAAMRSVPRHRFVPEPFRGSAYADTPLPIGLGQTVSQPYVVAAMAEALALRGGDKVLEVGSGSGYAAAVLSLVAGEVYGIELEAELHARSVEVVRALGYRNVHLRHGDGFLGWPEQAPFDAILLSCSAEEVPRPLWEQLRTGGRILYPRGPAGGTQVLVLVTKTPEGSRQKLLDPVRFFPMRRAP